jgi:hypothetical protein
MSWVEKQQVSLLESYPVIAKLKRTEVSHLGSEEMPRYKNGHGAFPE